MSRGTNTLFARTSLTLLAALLVFMLFTGFIMLQYILLPVARQSANDLAALMSLSARIWAQLPPEQRQAFAQTVQSRYGLKLRHQHPAGRLQSLSLPSPYMQFLQQALHATSGRELFIMQIVEQPDVYWVKWTVDGSELFIGFHHDHIGAEPPQAALIILLGAALFILLTTLLLVRRITRPLEILARGVQQLGSSGRHMPLPETGPRELAGLARTFNQLSSEIQRLLDNRTTLLGGISHDLRTPLARMRLALELLQGKAEAGLLENLQRDIDEMDALIARTLELTRSMQISSGARERLDLAVWIEDWLGGYEDAAGLIKSRLPGHCLSYLDPVVLRRILGNLLDNALKHAPGQPVQVHLDCQGDWPVIEVIDDGPGIPKTELERVMQPFHRLEPSRNRHTGGSGLGLAIVAQLAQMQGWRLRLENRATGGLSARLELRG